MENIVLGCSGEDERLNRIEGFLALGLLDDAKSELTALPETLRNSKCVTELFLKVSWAAKDYMTAIRHAKCLIALDPENLEPLIIVARCYRRLGCFTEALAWLDSTADKCNHYASHHYLKGCCLAAIGKKDLAETEIATALAINKELRSKLVAIPEASFLLTDFTGDDSRISSPLG